MKVKIILLASFLLVKIFNLNSQTDFRPGFIITNNHDTVFGLIDYRGDIKNSKSCSFKSEMNAQPVTYLPGEIFAYRFTDSKYYISKNVKTVNGEIPLFIEFLVDGIIDLYYYRDIDNDHYLIEKKDGSVVEMTNKEEEFNVNGILYRRESKQYIKILKVALADCFEIQKKAETAELNHKSLINITTDYHTRVCKDEECIVYQKKLPPLKIKLYSFIGYNVSFINKNTFSSFTMQSSIRPSIGLLFATCLPRVNEKVSFQIGLENGGYYFYGYDEKIHSFSNEYYDLHLKFNYINLMASLRYDYPKGKTRPYFTLGGGIQRVYLNKSRLVTEVLYHNEVYTYEQFYTSKWFTYNAGISVGANYYYRQKPLFYYGLNIYKVGDLPVLNIGLNVGFNLIK